MTSTLWPCYQWTSTAHAKDICIACKGASCACCKGTGVHFDPGTLQNARKRINSAFAERKTTYRVAK